MSRAPVSEAVPGPEDFDNDDGARGFVSAILTWIHFTTIILLAVITFLSAAARKLADMHGSQDRLNFLLAALVPLMLVSWMLKQRHQQRWSTAMQRKNAMLKAQSGELIRLNTDLDRIVESRTEDLARRESMIRSIVDTSSDAIITIDGRGHATFWNRAAEELFGYRSDEILGRSVTMIAPERYRDAYAAGLRRMIEAGESHVIGKRVEISGLHKSGAEIPIEISLATWSVGEEIFFTSIIRDITLRREFEAREKKMLHHLSHADKMNSLGSVAAGVAHELNNPLTGILGYAELIRDQTDSPEIRADIEAVIEEVTRCTRVVRTLLSFARKHDPEKSVVDINRVLTDAIELCSHQLELDGIETALLIDDRIPATLADAHQIQQVFINIINNGRQAMHGQAAPKRLSMATSLEDRKILIRFRDSGPGIADEAKNKIFDPFFTTKAVGQGTGLGLSLCYGFIAFHGGRILAENVSASDSASSRGAEFMIELPVVETRDQPSRAPDPSRKETSASGAAGPASGSLRLLVVDDEARIRTSMARLLQARGYRLTIAAGVDEAIAELSRSEFDIIICDIKMPGKPGDELYLHVCRAHPHLQRRFIFCTGHILTEEMPSAVAETHIPVIEKPCSTDDIERAIDRILRAGLSAVA